MSYGPCLCGAPDCPSCGPAQGYHRCGVCGEYACENEDHVDRDEGDERYDAAKDEGRL